MRKLSLSAVVSLLVGCSGSSGTSSSTGFTGTATSAASGTTGAALSSSSSHGATSGGTNTSSSGSSTSATAAASSSGGIGTASTSSGSVSGSTGGGPCTGADDSPCLLGTGAGGLCCDGVCEDVSSDPNNCGACYQFCSLVCADDECAPANCDGQSIGSLCAGNTGSVDPSETCDQGICVASACTTATADQECVMTNDAGLGACCANGCTALISDPNNCGTCGGVCPAGATCLGAQCSSDCATAGCPSGLLCTPTEEGDLCLPATCSATSDRCAIDGGVEGNCCSGSCSNPNTDVQNCGQCGVACSQGQFCGFDGCTTNNDCATAAVDAACALPGGGQGYCCGGNCAAATQNDPLNCGSCGVACPVPAVCVNDACYVDANPDGGQAYCSSAGESCPSGYACADGVDCYTTTCTADTFGNPCVISGNNTGACCGDACASLDTDSNCGGCGTVCGSGTFCYFGSCDPIPTCTPANDGTICPIDGADGVCCQGTCISTSNDTQNCNGCGNACAPGSVCNAGNCTLADGGFAGFCVTGPDGGCPSGTSCYGDNECLSVTCPAGETGMACSVGPYTTGQCCNGACVDTQQDPSNCGTCGTVCQSGICAGGLGQGSCLIVDAGPPNSCNTEFGGCTSDTTCVGDLCLANSCGEMGPGGLCSLDGIAIDLCCLGFGGADCKDLLTDPQNCGGCGVQCPESQTCSNGVCTGDVAPCGVGSRNLFCALPGQGLTSGICCPGGGCTNLQTDPLNCGYCGSPCQSGFSCVDGQCAVATCTSQTEQQTCLVSGAPTGQCCGTTCANIQSDPANCGACNTTCVGGETCLGGGCGFDSCSGEQGNPCHFDAGSTIEGGQCCNNACLDTQSDPLNCGGCNLACGGTAICSGGHCS